MTRAPSPNPLAGRSLRAPVLWGVVWGVIQAAAPLGFWWLDPAIVYALSLALTRPSTSASPWRMDDRG